MKKTLIYGLSAALLLVVVLAACHRPQADRPAEPQEPDPAVSTSAPADVSTPEPEKPAAPGPTADTVPEPEPEQTPATPAENEDTQQPAQEQTTESLKETEPVVQSSGSGTQTKPQGQQTQQQGGGSISLKDAAEQQGVTVTEQTGDSVWDQTFYDTLNPQQQEAYKNADDATRTQMKGIIESNRQMEQEGYQGSGNISPDQLEETWSNIIVN